MSAGFFWIGFARVRIGSGSLRSGFLMAILRLQKKSQNTCAHFKFLPASHLVTVQSSE